MGILIPRKNSEMFFMKKFIKNFKIRNLAAICVADQPAEVFELMRFGATFKIFSTLEKSPNSAA